MLGQHPETFDLPELNMFVADDVAEILRASNRGRCGMHGLLRALAQVHDGAQTQATVQAAKRWLETRSDWSTKRVLDEILDAIAPKMAVETSPRTALQPDAMERAYSMYPEASFMHLVRHPRSTAKAIRSRLEHDAEFENQLGELTPEDIWLSAHENIMNFTAGLPLSQSMRIKVEALLSEPRRYLPQVAEWLDIDAGPKAIDAMLHPELSPFADYGPSNARFGADPDFLNDPARPEENLQQPSLEGEVEPGTGQGFSAAALKIAREFGYT